MYLKMVQKQHVCVMCVICVMYGTRFHSDKDTDIVIDSQKMFRNQFRASSESKSENRMKYKFLVYILKTIWQTVQETLDILETIVPERDFSTVILSGGGDLKTGLQFLIEIFKSYHSMV